MPATREAAPRSLDAAVAEVSFAKLSPGPGMSADEVATHQRARIHSAMVELAGESGYKSVTVRALTKRAGVSTKAFYEHFSDKEDCFLQTYECITRRAVKRIIAAQAGETDWRERLRRAFGAFGRELEQEQRAARLVLIEVYALGSPALAQAQRTEAMFEAMVAESFSRSPDDLTMPPLLIKGIVAGTLRVVRSRLLAGDAAALSGLGDELAEWALSYYNDALDELANLEGPTRFRKHSSALAASLSKYRSRVRLPSSDRELIMSATAKLATSKRYDELTTSDIRAATGVSSKAFKAHFENIEDCFISTVEFEAARAVANAARTQLGNERAADDRAWMEMVSRVVMVFCAALKANPTLSGLCFGALGDPGLDGLRCRERLLDRALEVVRQTAPGSIPLSGVSLEASIGAAWGAIDSQLTEGRASALVHSASSLSFLILAPQVGPWPALESIRDVQRSVRLV